MNIVEIIEKKRDRLTLTHEEITYFIEAYTDGRVTDYQASALLMAIYFQGLQRDELLSLTKAMIASGDVFDLHKYIDGVIVDKHSTGGVGDTTSLIVGPIVASAGVPVAKMSGRGLGHTGGTVDKFESIEGFKIELSEEEFFSQVQDINLAIIGQTQDVALADKKLYALRDVTGTVRSIPLIASSIMSKKLASGADKIVLDVKVGSGAFMRTLEEAEELAKTMVAIGHDYGKETVALLTNMDQPLGEAIGNASEVLEAMDVLRLKGSNDLVELSLAVAGEMISLAKGISHEEGKQQAKEELESLRAYEKFKEFVARQGGNLNDFALHTEKKYVVRSKKTGRITSIDTDVIGRLLVPIGGARMTKEDVLDYNAAVYIHVKKGEVIKEGELLVTICYTTSTTSENELGRIIEEAIHIDETLQTEQIEPVLLGRITFEDTV